MFAQPMSSPMMNTTLGFCGCCCCCCTCCGCGCGSGTRCCCCAATGVLATAPTAADASRASHNTFMFGSSLRLAHQDLKQSKAEPPRAFKTLSVQAGC